MLGISTLAAVRSSERAEPLAPRSTPRIEAPSGPLDLNRACADELERLPRIGPALARRIIAHRETIGAFHSVDELDDVPGIGPSVLASIRPLVSIDGGPRALLPPCDAR